VYAITNRCVTDSTPAMLTAFDGQLEAAPILGRESGDARWETSGEVRVVVSLLTVSVVAFGMLHWRL